MATANKVFVSPGVYTSERDLSFVAQSVGVTTLGIVGETLRGPAFEPIFITSFDEFQTYFGDSSAEKFVNTQIPKYEASYIAKSYLQQSNQLFVTRILGLSGYDAGPSWSIKTIANVDPTTVDIISAGSSFTVPFTALTSQSSIGFTGSFPAVINGVGINTPYEKFDGSVTTLNNELISFIYNIISASGATSGTSIDYFGSIDTTDYTVLSSTFTAETNALEVDNVSANAADFTSSLNDSWYYLAFNNYSADNYSGFSFYAAVSSLTGQTGGTGAYTSFTGVISGKTYNYSGTAYSDYNNLVLATLRSRGIATYTVDTGAVYEVSGTSDVTLVTTGAYSGVSKNPFNTFQVSGVTNDGKNFTFDTSFTLSDPNYVTKVFGMDNFGKPRTLVPLFIEESYQNLLVYAYNMGYIRGISSDLTALPESRNGNPSSIGWYLERYQTPKTPYLVSELRGNKVYNLFRFYTISDGDDANTQVKVSIINISFNNGTFDVIVRDYFDTDENPVVYEKFTNCTMDPATNSFIAKRIGTVDGEFALNSKYIMVEMNEDAPIDALPCGFEGYLTRIYGNDKSPFPIYKTKYDFPGEVIFNPPFGLPSGGDNSVQSAGDKVRRTYLGFSTQVGLDESFLQYKGKRVPTNICTATEGAEWNYKVKGFHMDSGATVVTIGNAFTTSGESAFYVGDASFQNDPENQDNPYYFLYARKFTVAFAGGFDGWDIYREYRTNNDNFVLGASGYKKGACPSIKYPTATGWGAFKPITVGDNTVDYANTDYYAYLLGIQTFQNPEAVNINVFVTPGIDYINNSNLVEAAIDMIETQRADSIYICTTPDYNMFVPTTVGDTDLIYPQEAVDNLDNTGIDSNYTATYYPWVLTRDTVNNTQIYIPATAEVTRNLALTDNIAFPWFASAGYTRGLVNSVKARLKLTQEDRDILYKGRINPIATFSDVGTVIWGNKTLQIRESALDRLNVRRLLLQARKLISAVAIRLLFEQNDDKVRQQFLDSVNPILDSIRRDRGLYDFRVTVSNDPADLDRNQLTGKIYIKPTKALEFIDIEFLITPTGASFENI